MKSENFIINAFVTDENEKPIKSAAVCFTKSPVPMPDIALLTNSSGNFILSVPTEGEYEISIQSEKHYEKKIRFDTDAINQINLKIILKKI